MGAFGCVYGTRVWHQGRGLCLPFHARGLLPSVPETAIAALILYAALVEDSLVVVCDQEGFR